jgi:hypothetical protein
MTCTCRKQSVLRGNLQEQSTLAGNWSYLQEESTVHLQETRFDFTLTVEYTNTRLIRFDSIDSIHYLYSSTVPIIYLQEYLQETTCTCRNKVYLEETCRNKVHLQETGHTCRKHDSMRDSFLMGTPEAPVCVFRT